MAGKKPPTAAPPGEPDDDKKEQPTEDSALVPVDRSITPEVLMKYDPAKYNRLFPSVTVASNLGYMQEARVEVVRLSTNLQTGGDCYLDSRVGQPSLTKTALDKIAFAGGLSMHPLLSRVEERSRDYCRCKAVGIMKKADGTPFIVSRTKEWDLELEQEIDRDRYEKKVKELVQKKKVNPGDAADWVNTQVRKNYLHNRQNLVPFTESKAWNRVVRSCFGIKSSYTMAELAKPFVVVRFDTAFNPNDPAIARLLVERAQDAIGSMFDSGIPGMALEQPKPEPIAEPVGEPVGEPVAQAEPVDPLEEPPDAQAVDEYETHKLERVVELQEKPLGVLKEMFMDLLKSTAYDPEADIMGFYMDWKRTNELEQNQRAGKRAEILFDFERYAQSGNQEKDGTDG